MLQYRENIVELFLENAVRNPAKLAVVDARESVTYGQLRERALRIACLLLDMGLNPGDRVAYLVPNGINIIASYVAIQYMGAVAVPLNPRLSPSELLMLCHTARISCLLVDIKHDALGAAVAGALPDDVRVLELGMREGSLPSALDLYAALAGNPESHSARLEADPLAGAPDLYRNPRSLSRIQFTGGTSGLPKGAARTHHADVTEIQACVASNRMGTVHDPVALIQCPLEHHGGHSWFASMLSVGGTIVIVDKFDTARILNSIAAYGVTHIILLPPTTYLRLLEGDLWKHYDLSTVSIIQSSAGALPREAIERVFEAFPNGDLNYGWGQSESGTGTSLCITREMLAADDPAIASVGKPMNTLEVRIVDADGNDLGPNQPGEAIARTPCMMQGYYNLPGATMQAFTDDGWLRTGDIMEIDERGYIYVRSRKKDMVKSGGENVFVNEVQRALLDIPGIEDCIVFGTPDLVFDEAVAAIVQLRPGVCMSRRQISDECKRRIASYKKPRYIDFIPNLNRDDAGKLRTSDLIAGFEAHKAECLVHVHD